ncbi:hypothetical protein BDZ89DRAFT_648608 [Hymenopellis radicata]|nr:hypothetical protein BDZ89DRAFT_648608 [Hymenopellis radicata]
MGACNRCKTLDALAGQVKFQAATQLPQCLLCGHLILDGYPEQNMCAECDCRVQALKDSYGLVSNNTATVPKCLLCGDLISEGYDGQNVCAKCASSSERKSVTVSSMNMFIAVTFS